MPMIPSEQVGNYCPLESVEYPKTKIVDYFDNKISITDKMITMTIEQVKRIVDILMTITL